MGRVQREDRRSGCLRSTHLLACDSSGDRNRHDRRTPELERNNDLLTGGTGSFGRQFLRTILDRHSPREIRVFSRDELKQSELAHRFRAHDNIAWFIGDVRDRERLARAAEGVDLIVHAAAMKQVRRASTTPSRQFGQTFTEPRTSSTSRSMPE